MTYILGENCHVILSHLDIDAGADYGFILAKDNTVKSEGVQIIRQVQSISTTYADIPAGTSLYISFNVLCADKLRNPDGTEHAASRAADYAKLLQFLDKQDGIVLTCSVGSFLDLGALGWSADERHMPNVSQINCDLNNVGYYFPPIDPALLILSIWDGPLTWSTSFWR